MPDHGVGVDPETVKCGGKVVVQSCFCQAGCVAEVQELSGTPNPWYLLKSIACTNGRRTAVQMGGVLRYKLEAYCSDSLSSRLRSQQGTALQMGGVLRYKLEMYCQYFLDKLYWLGVPQQCPEVLFLSHLLAQSWESTLIRSNRQVGMRH